MSAPKMSDLTTHGIRVGATAFFLPHESVPDEGRYLFGYSILIVNLTQLFESYRSKALANGVAGVHT